MQESIARPQIEEAANELSAALPLYAASLVVTLAGVGAVGVTVSPGGWTPVWVALTVVGHLVSLTLRRLRVPADVLFFPVMILGCAFALQQKLAGSPLVGMDSPLRALPSDMAMAVLVGAIAVVRSFTLVTNAALLFSPVPAISMVALVGSTNPNAEIPLFFSLLILGSLFITGYDGHLRRSGRSSRSGRPGPPVIFHLLNAWCITLAVVAGALLAPLAVQPALGPLSPFALTAVSRARTLTNFAQGAQNQAPVGQGPIMLSPTPMFALHSPEGGLVRTGVYVTYTGRSWTTEFPPNVVDVRSDTQVHARPRGADAPFTSYRLFHHRFPPEQEPRSGHRPRLVRQWVETHGYNPAGIPGLGRIQEIFYPRSTVNLHYSGAISGSGHGSPGQVFEVVSRVVEFAPEQLRTAPPVDPAEFDDPDTLSLPQSTRPVQALARQVTAGISNPHDRVWAIIRHIEKTCVYTLQEEPTPAGQDAASFYLFQTRRGACDLAATAAALMCRSVGIPARVAVGYVAEEPLPTGEGYLVRQEHGHMWFEAYFPGFGWVPFNPAPTASQIRDQPLQILFYQVQSLFRKIGGGGLDALLLVLVVLLTMGLGGFGLAQRLRARLQSWSRRRRMAREGPAAATTLLYLRTLRLLERRGWRREGWMTPREFLESLRTPWQESPAALAAFATLTDSFERARYAQQPPPESYQAAMDACQLLARAAPRRPRRPRPSHRVAVPETGA